MKFSKYKIRYIIDADNPLAQREVTYKVDGVKIRHDEDAKRLFAEEYPGKVIASIWAVVK